MAYMRSLDEQNKQQGQGQNVQQGMPGPTFIGSQNITADPGTQAASANTAPKTGNPGDDGTGSGNWVNIDSYLNANPSMGQTAVNKSNSLLGDESSNFNKASKGISDATKNFKLKRMTPDSVHTSLQFGDLDSIKNVLNQPGYNGPNTVNYSTDDNKNLIDARKLGDRNTAADVLASDAIKQGNYGNGMRTLDTSLLGADQNYKTAAPTLFSNVNDFINKTNESKSGLEGLAKWDTQAVNDMKNSVRGELNTEKDNYKKAIEDQVKTQKGVADMTKKSYADAYADWYKNQYQNKTDANNAALMAHKNPSDFTQNDLFKYGSISDYADPNAQNAGTDEQYKVLGGIGNILGESPVYSSSGTYKLPSYTSDKGQGAIDEWKNGPGKTYNVGSAGNVNMGNNWVANQILSSGNVETPEQLYKRLGLS